MNFNINILEIEDINLNIDEFKCAVREKNITRVNELISEETVLKKDNNGNTFLHVVAKDGNVETAIRLLKCRADVHATNNKGKTPIFYAITNSEEMVKVLLDDSRVDNWQIICQALLYGTERIVQLLINRNLLKIQNNLVQCATSTTNSKLDELQNITIFIDSFLQHELHLMNMEDSYPVLIFFAARICRKDVLHIILNDCRKNLANINQKKIESKRRILHEPRAPEELNVQSSHGGTALHYPVVHQLVEAARFLLEEGADPNCQTYQKFTPLHFASCLRNKEMCQLLLSFGANVNPNCGFPYDPLSLVCSPPRHNYREFDNYGNCFEKCLMDLNKLRFLCNTVIMKLLIEHGANIDSRSEHGLLVLFQICQFGRLDDLKIFLEYGGNIRTLQNGASALHHAVCGKSLEIVDFLLEEGFDINLKNEDNCTPLLSCVYHANNNCVGIIEYLVDRGADINALDSRGNSALHIAACSERILCLVEYLLELGADWSILNIDETRIGEYAMPIDNAKVLISFIALREKELSNYIKFYVGNSEEKLNEAFDYFQKSKLEIKKLRMTNTAKDFSISFFDFLTKDFYTSVQIAKNSDLKAFFNSDKYMDEFPCYGSLLKHRFEMTQKLENFVNTTFDFMLNYTNLLPELVELIMKNFRTIDFRVFGKVLSNKRF